MGDLGIVPASPGPGTGHGADPIDAGVISAGAPLPLYQADMGKPFRDFYLHLGAVARAMDFALQAWSMVPEGPAVIAENKAAMDYFLQKAAEYPLPADAHP